MKAGNGNGPRRFLDNYKTAKWQRMKARILDRDEYRCAVCATDMDLTVHHGVYARKSDGLNPVLDVPDDTLWTLCWECHRKVQNIRRNILEEMARVPPRWLVELPHFPSWVRAEDIDPERPQWYLAQLVMEKQIAFDFAHAGPCFHGGCPDCLSNKPGVVVAVYPVAMPNPGEYEFDMER